MPYQKNMRAVDLFSGCGGMSKGFQDAGYSVAAAYDCWDTALECYRLNFDHPAIRADLSDVGAAVPLIKRDSPDIIIGGPPCQDFSAAGKRIESERANLTRCFAEIVSQVSPPYFVMENVSRAASSKAYADAREIFKESGYGLTETVLDASFCGVPQSRKRFVCIGIKGSEDGRVLSVIKETMSEKPMTLRDYFGDSLDFDYYYRHPRNYSRRGIFSVDEPAPTIRGVNRPLPAGYRGNPNDPCPVSDGIRALSTLERSMIQTFPPDYRWAGSKTEMEQMIGNAVPVNLARFVGTALNICIERIKNGSRTDSDVFDALRKSIRQHSVFCRRRLPSFRERAYQFAAAKREIGRRQKMSSRSRIRTFRFLRESVRFNHY